MNLIKKIAKGMAIGALSLGIMTGCYSMGKEVARQGSVWDEIERREIARQAEEKEIAGEAEKYGRIFVKVNPSETFLGWDRDKDGREDFRCAYKTSRATYDGAYLQLTKSYEDKNRNGTFEEDEQVEEKGYQEFLFYADWDYIKLDGDEYGNKCEDRRYLYQIENLKLGARERVGGSDSASAKLIGIQKDVNQNQRFEEGEFIWREEKK